MKTWLSAKNFCTVVSNRGLMENFTEGARLGFSLVSKLKYGTRYKVKETMASVTSKEITEKETVQAS